MKKSHLSLLLIFAVIIIDQAIKYLVKTNMYLGQDIEILPFFHIHFIENNGMAFGMELFDKYFLTSFRIVAVALISFYLYKLIKKDSPLFLIICISLILAGAAGNIFDCLFYGLIFNQPSLFEAAHLVSFGSGYGDFMLGRVVDMFYFPLFTYQWNGQENIFFSAIFNFADACISCAVAALIVCSFVQNHKAKQ